MSLTIHFSRWYDLSFVIVKSTFGLIIVMACGAATRSTNEGEIRPGSHSTQKKRNTNAVKCTEYRESEAISTQTNSCKTNIEKKRL